MCAASPQLLCDSSVSCVRYSTPEVGLHVLHDPLASCMIARPAPAASLHFQCSAVQSLLRTTPTSRLVSESCDRYFAPAARLHSLHDSLASPAVVTLHGTTHQRTARRLHCTGERAVCTYGVTHQRSLIWLAFIASILQLALRAGGQATCAAQSRLRARAWACIDGATSNTRSTEQGSRSDAHLRSCGAGTARRRRRPAREVPALGAQLGREGDRSG